LEIRVKQGIAISILKEASDKAQKLVSEFIADGLIDPKAAIGGYLKLTLKGRLLADSLVRQLLAD
jgi:oxygen-independent coproporphyrinogen-3 oxidase